MPRVDLADTPDARRELALVLGEEPRDAVVDDRGESAPAHGDHRRAAGQRLERCGGARLVPSDREQRHARGRQQPLRSPPTPPTQRTASPSTNGSTCSRHQRTSA